MPKAVEKVVKKCAHVKCKKEFLDEWGTKKFCNEECKKRQRWLDRQKKLGKRGRYNRKVYISLWCKAGGKDLGTVPCHYCETELTVDTFVIDHKVPSSELKTRDEKYEMDNLVLACKSCNLQKGVLPYEMFYTWKQSTIIRQELDTEKTASSPADTAAPSTESSQGKAS